MCDDFTANDDDDELRARGLSRRDFAALSAAAALAAATPAWAAPKRRVSERAVSIKTADGTCDALFFHPATGKHPGIVMWPDIAGIRDSFKVMARRLAGEGYAVLLVNQYYRSTRAPVMASLSEWRTPEGQAKLKPMIAAITPDGTTRDARAFVAFLDAQKAVDTKRKIGSNGYCMGGPFTVRTAAAVPARVGAAASLHGGGLVGTEPTSPTMLLPGTRAAYLFAIGKNDDAKAPAEKDALKAAAAKAGRPAEVEVYNADHGWTVPDAPSYNQAEAERAWVRMLALFSKL